MWGGVSVSGARGFTLIEVLVVVILVAVIMATIVGGFTGADREQELKGLVNRIAMRIEMARDRAVQSNREWGVFVSEEALSFAIYDEVNDEWVTRSERAFQSDATGLELEYRLEVEELAGVVQPEDNNEDEEIPQLWLFSSGEVMPFTLQITPRAVDVEPWYITSDGFSRATAQRERP
ncbi:MAG: type II secretion system minor pseudopilin GspH [Pseudomonadales bacterium]